MTASKPATLFLLRQPDYERFPGEQSPEVGDRQGAPPLGGSRRGRRAPAGRGRERRRVPRPLGAGARRGGAAHRAGPRGPHRRASRTTGRDATPDYGGLPFRPAARPAEPPPPPRRSLPSFRFLADWPRYRVERFLGSGGMGTVYKAFDPSLDRWVALKFLHRNDASHTDRFLREARAQARVSHPNVCQIHEVGEAEGRPYIAMQYIDGRSLGELCEELTREDKARLIRDVAHAVHTAHRTGLVHRDLKPGNILLTRGEGGEIHPYVVDFGLAVAQDEVSLSRTGMISGTPAYISPEQAQGQPIDRRTDVYSLGIVLYELLAGAPPFTGGNLARILVQLVQEDAKPLRQVDPAIPEDLETIVAKCLEKDPSRRYGSARELAEDLDRFLDGEPIRARPAGWAYRAGKRLRKNRALAAVSVAAVLALLGLGLLSLRAAMAGPRARRAGAEVRPADRLAGDQPGVRGHPAAPRHHPLQAEAAGGDGFHPRRDADDRRDRRGARAFRPRRRGRWRSGSTTRRARSSSAPGRPASGAPTWPRRWASPTAGPTSAPCRTPTAPPPARGRPAARRPSAPTAGPPSTTCARACAGRPARRTSPVSSPSTRGATPTPWRPPARCPIRRGRPSSRPRSTRPGRPRRPAPAATRRPSSSPTRPA